MKMLAGVVVVAYIAHADVAQQASHGLVQQLSFLSGKFSPDLQTGFYLPLHLRSLPAAAEDAFLLQLQ